LRLRQLCFDDDPLVKLGILLLSLHVLWVHHARGLAGYGVGTGALRAASQEGQEGLIGCGERVFCLLKGIAEGTYNSKHAEAARLYYTTTTTTTTTHIHTHTHLLSFKLEHAHERRCGPNH